MSEKVTFGELIESIAEQTDNSRKFTHDFLKDFVSVINSGLEEDAKVNIAGFGKFELREMDEREGYNPQTGEKMTIPAQNKVTFKPYKDFRELVNAPYAHLEPELLEEEEEEQEESKTTSRDRESEETAAGLQEEAIDEGSPQNEEKEQEFIPSAPPNTIEAEEPTEDTDQEASDEDEEEEREDSHRIHFTLDLDSEDTPLEDEPAPTESEESDDIVEFHLKPEETEEAIETEPESVAEDTEQEQQPEPSSSYQRGAPSGTNGSGRIWIIAAVIALVIAALGVWMMTSQSDTATQSSEPLATKAIQPQADQSGSSQESQANNQTNNTPSSPDANAGAGAQSQSGQSSQGNQASMSAQSGQQRTQPDEPEAHTIDIEQGETLWSLARANYGDPYLWPWIYETNEHSLDNPNLIIAGHNLSLPVPDLPGNKLSPGDSLEVAIGYVRTYRWYKTHGNNRAKFYLRAATIYDQEVFDHIDRSIDKDDLAFANRVR